MSDADADKRTGRLPWDRLTEHDPKWPEDPNRLKYAETPTQYSQFAAYRDMGRGRTVAKLAEQLKRSRGHLAIIAARNHWTRRAEAWDREQDRQFNLRMAARREEAADRTLAMIGVARTKLIERLRTLDPERFTPAEWIKWFEVLTKLEREVTGLPSQTVAMVGKDGGPVEMIATIAEMDDDTRKKYLMRLVAEAQQRAGVATAGAYDDDLTWEGPDGTAQGTQDRNVPALHGPSNPAGDGGLPARQQV